MQVTVTIDDALFEQAIDLADPEMVNMGTAELFRVALETFVRVRSAQRLAALGGAQTAMSGVTRRREGESE
jgi:hypothetical protein